MTSRPRHSPLTRALAARFRALQNALTLRMALRAVAAVGLAFAIAIAIGALVPGGSAAAWARLLAFAFAVLVALVWVVRIGLRLSLGFEQYLARIEQRFPEVRSWLRNALDFESRPPQDTSEELALAVQQETAKRIESVPVASLHPRLEPKKPGAVLAAALLVLLVIGIV